ncbi:MAG: glycosyltransferase family 2 protein [Candidatus Peribacteraceae bacterium]|nr:glycosyltransferase family 2 protein [Candidatus Peribacteraceae bacterium]
MEHPLVSAVVLNFRTPQAAVKCVQAMLAQTIADRLEILLVDNHSQDDSIGVLRVRFGGHPQVKIIEVPTNRGYGGGNNFAIRRARGEFLFIINPDNELQPDGLERLIAALREDPTIGILAPRLVYDDGSLRDSHRAFPTLPDVLIKRTFLQHLFRRRLDRYLQRDRDASQVQETDWVHGACFLIRRSFFGELGGFDERFFLFFEDTDLCRRIWARGKRVVYFPLVSARDIKVRLSEGGVWTLFTKRTARAHVVSALKYFWKWKSARLTRT